MGDFLDMGDSKNQIPRKVADKLVFIANKGHEKFRL